MKYIILALLICSLKLNGQIVNIPDPNFKYALVHNPYVVVDKNGDGEIQVSEAEAINEDLSVLNSNVTDLTGIEAFINMKQFTCNNNYFPELTIKNLPNLEILSCGTNKTTKLTLVGLSGLKRLFCNENELSYLDLKECPNIEVINCCFNSLWGMDISACTKLRELYCYENKLNSLDLKHCAGFEQLWAGYNHLYNLEISNLKKLFYIECHNNRLNYISLKGLDSLQMIDCRNNYLNALDLSGLDELLFLNCSFNKIEEINPSGLPRLVSLFCNNNQLGQLNVSNCANLQLLQCDSNHISALNLNNAPVLNYLSVPMNDLKHIILKDGVLNNIDFLSTYHNPDLEYICKDEDDIIPATTIKINTDCEVSSIDLDKVNTGISIYPNPSSQYLFVEFNSVELSSLVDKVKIYRYDGKLAEVVPHTQEAQKIMVNINNYEKGMYLLSLIHDDKIIKSLPFIISH